MLKERELCFCVFAQTFVRVCVIAVLFIKVANYRSGKIRILPIFATKINKKSVTMIKKLIFAASLLIVANVFAFAQDEIDDGSRVKIRLFYSGGTSKYDVYYDDVVQLATGESVAFEPVDKNDGAGTGTWVWTDPDGSQNVRQVRNFVNVTIDKAGVYTIERKNNNVVVYRHKVKIYVDGKLSKDEQLATYPKNDQADAAYKAFNDAFLVTRLADNKPHGTYYKEGYNSGDAGKLYCWEQGLDILMLTKFAKE